MQHGNPPVNPVLLQAGESVGGYTVQEKIGEGTFGLVYQVEHAVDTRPRALKLLKVWSVPVHARKNLEARFRLEYETGKIPGDYLVKTHDYGEWCNCPYFVMDYCSRGSLRDRIIQGLGEKQCIAIAQDILIGLKALHENGKVHRDLKPENILFDERDKPLLTDFGIAGHLNIQLTVVDSSGRPQDILGSYAYMAPEQVSPVHRKQTLLPTVDIFTFGVICYEMFTGGKYPFGRWETEEDIVPYLKRASRGEYDEVTFFNDRVPDLWAHIIRRALASDHNRRYQHIDDILRDLGQPSSLITGGGQRPRTDILLKIMQGEEPGRIYDLNRISQIQNTNYVRIGRSSTNSNNEADIYEGLSAYVSRAHATFERHKEHNAWLLRDGQWIYAENRWKPSRNGTYINGEEVDAEFGKVVHIGDIITMGNTTLKVERGDVVMF